MANIKLSETTLVYGEPTDENGLGGINMNSMVFPNMGTPVALTDSANKDYVDTQVATIPAYNFTNILNSSSGLVVQAPPALDTPQFVGLGPEVLTGDVTLVKKLPADPEGNELVFNVNGVYSLILAVNMGQPSATGRANVLLQGCLDGVPLPAAFILKSFPDDTVETHVFTIPDVVISSAPQIVDVMLASSSIPVGVNIGGLFAIDVTSVLPSFTTSASATIIVNRLY